MFQLPKIATLALAALALSACATGSQERAEEAKNDRRQQQHAANSGAESACITAANRGSYSGQVKGLTVTGSGQVAGGTQVNLTARGKKWKCMVSDDGKVQEMAEVSD